MMSVVASSSSPVVTARKSIWRPRNIVLLLGLGPVVLSATVFLLLKVHRASSKLAIYAVEGKILVNGAPAENLNVAFHPLGTDNNLICPVGRTNSKGLFHLTTRADADGAPPGEYSVTLVWPDGLLDECECVDPSLHDRLKGIYAKPKQSRYHATVGTSGNTFWWNVVEPNASDKLPPGIVKSRTENHGAYRSNF